ncbi:MAG TPA: SDR family NAD(P)-dependent oxidoreductase [Acidimicrobiia bacterium]
MLELNQRVAVVTGASRGLGRNIAYELARGGCRVALVARGAASLTATAEEIETETGTHCMAIPADVTEPADRNEILNQTEHRLGPPDILVNGAGITKATTFSDEEARRIVATNLEAPIELTRLATHAMAQKGRGAILNIASVAGKVGLPFVAEYSATKAGLIAFSNSVREELRGTGVTVTVTSPGFMVDEGMYVPYHTPPPWYFGANRSAVVARKAVEAMRRGRSDVILNARPVRPLLALGAISEPIMRSMMRILGTTGFMQSLADKRLPYSDSPDLVASSSKPKAMAPPSTNDS